MMHPLMVTIMITLRLIYSHLQHLKQAWSLCWETHFIKENHFWNHFLTYLRHSRDFKEWRIMVYHLKDTLYFVWFEVLNIIHQEVIY